MSNISQFFAYIQMTGQELVHQGELQSALGLTLKQEQACQWKYSENSLARTGDARCCNGLAPLWKNLSITYHKR